MKVVLVDDERIALEHLQSLIPWEQHGFDIAGTATNGRSALRLCDEVRPHLMIVDIRMPVMDGLELIRMVAEREHGVQCLVMSAYEDFDYARQAISLGNVSGYLVKHEVNRETLIRELNKARLAWEADAEGRRLQRSERLKKAVLGADLPSLLDGYQAKPPLAMMLLQPDIPFTFLPSASRSIEIGHAVDWAAAIKQLREPAGWELLGEFPLGAEQWVVLYEQTNKNAPALREEFRAFAAAFLGRLATLQTRGFSGFYGFQTSSAIHLPQLLCKLDAAARHAVFCGKNVLACVDELPLPETCGVSPYSRNPRLDELLGALQPVSDREIETAINKLFESLRRPVWDLPGLYETVHALTGLYHERLASAGLPLSDPLDEREHGALYHFDDLRVRFVQAFQRLGTATRFAPPRLSPKLDKAIRYLHEHFQDDINIEDVSYAIGISPSYLHQLFKRKLGRTFLDELTEYRVRQAQRILANEDVKMTEVSARVGYRSTQHFSQVFKRLTGMQPHQFRAEGRYR